MLKRLIVNPILEGVRAEMDARFEAQDQKFTAMFDAMDRKFTEKIESRFDTLSRELHAVERRLSERLDRHLEYHLQAKETA